MSQLLFEMSGEMLNITFKPNDAQKFGTGAHIWVQNIKNLVCFITF